MNLSIAFLDVENPKEAASQLAEFGYVQTIEHLFIGDFKNIQIRPAVDGGSLIHFIEGPKAGTWSHTTDNPNIVMDKAINDKFYCTQFAADWTNVIPNPITRKFEPIT